jgi:hypothetical protein
MAVVMPVGKDTPEEKRGESTTRKKTPKEITSPLADKRPKQRPGESRRDDPTDGGENARSRGRSETRCRSGMLCCPYAGTQETGADA